MKTTALISLIIIAPFLMNAQNSAKELIAASIKFHDPDNNWLKTKASFTFSDTRPGKDARAANLYLNNLEATLCVMREQDGVSVTYHVINDKCSYDIDGNIEPSLAEVEKYKLNEKRSIMLRNYYLYLWGLPMKLNDVGTIVDSHVYDKNFNGEKTKAVKVTYKAEVGSDIWYFYFNPNSSEMVGYQFFHDEAKGDGEYILLSGLVEVNGMSIPKNRAWYTNPDSTLLGTDHLIEVRQLQHLH